MSDVDEKLIVKLGQRISEQNEILRMIAASLQGVESHLRQIAVSSNTAPNYQRPLSEYPTFDWSSIGATVLNRDGDGATASNGTARSSRADLRQTNSMRRSGFRAIWSGF